MAWCWAGSLMRLSNARILRECGDKVGMRGVEGKVTRMRSTGAPFPGALRAVPEIPQGRKCIAGRHSLMGVPASLSRFGRLQSLKLLNASIHIPSEAGECR